MLRNLTPLVVQQFRQPRDGPMAMDGRAVSERRTSLFYAELGANLCEQVFQLVHFSFETRDVGLHRREFRDAEGWRLSR